MTKLFCRLRALGIHMGLFSFILLREEYVSSNRGRQEAALCGKEFLYNPQTMYYGKTGIFR